jgi:Bacterial membrane protein YfhO
MPALALVLFALILMWRPVVLGHTFLPIDGLLHLQPWRYSYERVPVNNPRNTDPTRQLFPRRLLTNTIVEQGALPLWNPSILTGTPLLDDGQLAFFYPLSLIFFLLPVGPAFGYYAFVHLILAGFGCYFFTRQLGLGRGGAILSGLCTMLSGYMLTWLQYPEHTAATAMLPWCFWAVARAMTRNRWSAWLLCGAVLALPVVSQLQIAFYTYVGVGCFLLWSLWHTPAWSVRLRHVIGFSGAVLLALALSAIQLVPAFDLAATSQRSTLAFTPNGDVSYFTMLLRLGLPALEGIARVGPPPTWGVTLLQVPYPYIGLIPLLLLPIALWFTRYREGLFFGVLAVVSFVLAMGSPLLQLVIWLVPFYRQFEDHTRWFVLWGFAAAVLAGMGAEVIATRDWRSLAAGVSQRMRTINRGLLIGLALGLGGWCLYHMQLFTPASRYGTYITLIRQQQLLPPLLFASTGLLALLLLALPRLPTILRWSPLLLLVFADLSWYGGSYNSSTDMKTLVPTSALSAELATYPPAILAASQDFPPTRQTAFLQSQPGPFRIFGADPSVFPPNVAGAYGLEDIRGYHSLFTSRYMRLARMADGKDFTVSSAGSAVLRPYFTSVYTHRRILDMLNVQYVVFGPDNAGAANYAPLEPVHQSDEGTIYRNPTVLPRAWLVHQIEVIPNDEAQLTRMARTDFDPGTLAVLADPAPSVAASTGSEAVPTLNYRPNEVTVHANPTAPALLVLSDAYHNGWQVQIDGQPAPLYRANYALRGVWLPAGPHTVTFSYRPSALLLGAGVSVAALLIVCGAAFWRTTAKVTLSR